MELDNHIFNNRVPLSINSTTIYAKHIRALHCTLMGKGKIYLIYTFAFNLLHEPSLLTPSNSMSEAEVHLVVIFISTTLHVLLNLVLSTNLAYQFSIKALVP